MIWVYTYYILIMCMDVYGIIHSLLHPTHNPHVLMFCVRLLYNEGQGG